MTDKNNVYGENRPAEEDKKTEKGVREKEAEGERTSEQESEEKEGDQGG